VLDRTIKRRILETHQQLLDKNELWPRQKLIRFGAAFGAATLAVVSLCGLIAQCGERPHEAQQSPEQGKVTDYGSDIVSAIRRSSEAIRLNPKGLKAYCLRAEGYLATQLSDQIAKAIADCDEVIRLDPKNAEAYRIRARAYEEKRDWDSFGKAIDDLNEAIRLDLKNPHLYRARGMTAFKMGRSGYDFNVNLQKLEELNREQKELEEALKELEKE